MISKGKPVMVGDEYYDVRCLSTDVKPTKQIKNGSLLIEIDTGKRYLFDYEQKAWNEVPFDSGAAPATTSTAGIVKPDGKTIDVSQDGTISIATEGDGAIRSVTAEGWAEQARTTGKNLFAPRALTTSGITFSVMPDGGTKVAGTSTVNYASNQMRIEDESLKGKTVTLSCAEATTSCFVQVNCYYNSSNHNFTTRDAPSITFVIPSQTEIIYYGVSIPTSGTTVDVIMHPQLELGSTATEYEPYTGGAPSPSPDYPQEIQVARGRNLLNESAMIDGKYLKAADGSLLNSDSFRCSDYIEVESGTHAIQMVQGSPADSVRVCAYNASKGYVSTLINATPSASSFFSDSFTVPVSAKYVRFSFPKTCQCPQLESGSTPTPYVPYGHVGLEVRGKNLLPRFSGGTVGGITATARDDGSVVVNGTASATVTFSSSVTLAAGTYTLSGCPANGSDTTYKMDAPAIASIQDRGEGSAFTLATERELAFRIRIGSGATVSNAVFHPQLESGTEATEYIPYHDVTIPIPLPSKGFAASLPDGTADTLTIDGAGHVEWESASEEYVVTGNETISSAQLGEYYRLAASVLTQPSKPSNTVGYCSKAPFVGGWTAELTHCYTNVSALYLYHTGPSAADVLAAYTGASVLYPLATPVTEDCGYVTLPITTEGDTVSIPELEDVAVVRWADTVATEVAQAWYRRAYAELGNAITDLAARVAALES